MICIMDLPISSHNILVEPVPSLLIYILDLIGLFGPAILFAMSLWQLWGNGIYWTWNLVLFIINMIINSGLKDWIREPRPVGGRSMTTYETYKGAQGYGMPSGHSQLAFGLVTYSYLVKPDTMYLIGGICIIGLTLYQRWKYKRHSIEQLCVGAVVGIIVTYISYTLITMGITGQ